MRDSKTGNYILNIGRKNKNQIQTNPPILTPQKNTKKNTPKNTFIGFSSEIGLGKNHT